MKPLRTYDVIQIIHEHHRAVEDHGDFLKFKVINLNAHNFRMIVVRAFLKQIEEKES